MGYDMDVQPYYGSPKNEIEGTVESCRHPILGQYGYQDTPASRTPYILVRFDQMMDGMDIRKGNEKGDSRDETTFQDIPIGPWFLCPVPYIPLMYIADCFILGVDTPIR